MSFFTCAAFYVLRRVTFCVDRKSPKNHKRERGFRCPLSLLKPSPLRRRKGRGLGPFPWNLSPGGWQLSNCGRGACCTAPRWRQAKACRICILRRAESSRPTRGDGLPRQWAHWLAMTGGRNRLAPYGAVASWDDAPRCGGRVPAIKFYLRRGRGALPYGKYTVGQRIGRRVRRVGAVCGGEFAPVARSAFEGTPPRCHGVRCDRI